VKVPFLVAALFVAPVLFGETADLRVVTSSIDNAPTATGQHFSYRLRWRNDGPDAAHFLFVSITGSPTPFYILNVATSGWPCYPTPDATTFTCQKESLAAGAEAELILDMLTPPTPGAFTLRSEVRAAEIDPQLANNTVQQTFALEATASADLSVSPVSQLYRASAGDEVSIPVVIANSGPAAVLNLFAVFTVPVQEFIPEFTGGGGGWSCQHPAYGPQSLTCTLPRLGPGQSAPLTITTEAPPADGTLPMNIRVRGEGHADPDITNDFAIATIQVGNGTEPPPPAQEWMRVLVPLTGNDVPGVGGAVWRTETTALVSSDTAIDIQPACDHSRGPSVPCLEIPLRKPFQPRAVELIDTTKPNGQFLYVRSADAARLHLSSRVYDVSRSTETAGSEIPIVRESRFTSAPVSLPGIPVAPQYRHTLRVYDLDATAGGRVLIRVYADDETTPRAETIRELTVPPAMRTIGAEHLPANPGYLQLDLGQLTPMGGIDILRVDVEPIDSMRLWSFVSITNNDTHHVTTFSQP